MPTHRMRLAVAALVVTLVAASASSLRAGGEEKVPLAVIVQKSSPVSELTLSELRAIFTADQQSWSHGGKVALFVLPPDTPERVSFDKIVLGMSADEAGRYWIDRRIRGNGDGPRAVPSVLMLNRVVAQTPGAVSYVRASQATDLVKVVRIDGKQPGDPGYPLVATIPAR